MVYPFIDNNTRDKFVFVDDKSLQETLHREVDESQLPEFLGGKMPLIPLKDYAQQSQSA
uniref:CRAL-TRIO domain-containing protein n=1 Tax=Arundo donax TaxID=35708 RepID=A0A0A9F036_ARUDO